MQAAGILFTAGILVCSLWAPLASAQTRVPVPNSTSIGTTDNFPDPAGTQIFVSPGAATDEGLVKLRLFVSQISNFILSILIAAAVLMLIIAGYLFVVANGNEEKLGKAKKTVQWVVVGLIVATLSWSLIHIVIRIWNAALPGGSCDPLITSCPAATCDPSFPTFPECT